MPDGKPKPERKYFGHNTPSTSETKEVSAPVVPIVVKKERFSFMKKNSSVAAH
jgi:hypothetical protein